MALAQNTSAFPSLGGRRPAGVAPPPMKPRLATPSSRRRPSRDADVRQEQGRGPSMLSRFPLQACVPVGVQARGYVVRLSQHGVADHPQDQVVSFHRLNLRNDAASVTLAGKAFVQ